jgi:hypothetical protein
MNHTERPNPVLWLVFALPALAVVASFTSLFLAIHSGDVPLPDNYHWEGAGYDADQARLNDARRLGVSAQLHFDALTQQCQVQLRGATPTQLRVDLTDGSKPSNDRHLKLQRAGDAYEAPCTALPVGHWWVEIADDASGWTLRERLHGNLSTPQLVASSGAGRAS